MWDPGVAETTGALEARGVGQGRESLTGRGCAHVIMLVLRSLGETFQGVWSAGGERGMKPCLTDLVLRLCLSHAACCLDSA